MNNKNKVTLQTENETRWMAKKQMKRHTDSSAIEIQIKPEK